MQTFEHRTHHVARIVHARARATAAVLDCTSNATSVVEGGCLSSAHIQPATFNTTFKTTFNTTFNTTLLSALRSTTVNTTSNATFIPLLITRYLYPTTPLACSLQTRLRFNIKPCLALMQFNRRTTRLRFNIKPCLALTSYPYRFKQVSSRRHSISIRLPAN
jgi:hypothetical protein